VMVGDGPTNAAHRNLDCMLLDSSSTHVA
jgi:hypothetical protein